MDHFLVMFVDWQIFTVLTDSKSPLSFVFFASIGLYSSITFVIIEEKRMPNRYDFIKLIGFIPFVWAFALLLPYNQLISFFIGIAPGPAFKYVKRKATKYFDDKDNDEGDEEVADKKSEIIKKEIKNEPN